MFDKNNFFEELEKSGVKVNAEQRKKIIEKIDSVLSYEPKIGIFGKTGVGKSSLCNALFGKDICEISDVKACTRDPKEVMVGMGQKGLKLIDVPGVGENSERDKEYADLYAKLLPELDLVLWLLKADDRAYTSDELFYKNVVEPHLDDGKAFFFVLNQVDKVEPFREWDEKRREPGTKQFKNIHDKVASVAEFFGVVSSKIIPISANEKYNLTKLVDEIVFALPAKQKVTLFKEVSEENRSEIAQKEVKRSIGEIVGDVVVTALETTGKVIVTTVETVGRVVEKAADKFFDWVERKTGCFITTAVCESMNKPDECYELTMFRSFRDNWLLKQDDGRTLISEYYDIAPGIVDKINALPDRVKVYENIWGEYLSVCLGLLEKNEYEQCKEIYKSMVSSLKKDLIN